MQSILKVIIKALSWFQIVNLRIRETQNSSRSDTQVTLVTVQSKFTQAKCRSGRLHKFLCISSPSNITRSTAIQMQNQVVTAFVDDASSITSKATFSADLDVMFSHSHNYPTPGRYKFVPAATSTRYKQHYQC